MTVYVDEAIFPHKNQLWCHMWSPNEEKLHKFAKNIKLSQRYFHKRTKVGSHYDLSPKKRVEAIALGAVPITCQQMLFLMKMEK